MTVPRLGRWEAGLFDGLDDDLQRVLIGRQVGSVAALVADAGGGSAVLLQGLLQLMEDLGAVAQGFLEALGADGHDHELLDIDAVGGVGAAVEDVHHGHGQGLGIDAADVVVQAHAGGLGRGLGAGQGDAEDGVGTQAGLIGGAVELDEHLVDGDLVQSVQADHGLGDFAVDVFDSHRDALAAVAGLVAVAKLAGLVDTGGSAGGDSRAADGAVIEGDLDFDRGVAAGVQDLTRENVNDFEILFHRYLSS